MNTKIKKYQNNFIAQIINQDFHKNKHLSFHTRFPPEPNGYLHIGHAKSICLNFELSKLYHGKCNLRFDDTNPLKENIQYIQAIKDDIHWLGYQYDNICYTSEYFSQLYQYAKQLIQNGLAYVDHLTKEEIREYRGSLTKPGKNSPYRNRTVEENITLFKKMKKGEFSEGEVCLRAKIDMKSASVIMRDPVIYRIIFAEHHQTKNKWCIYPMYDFAHCISDAIEEITHSLCTLEFQENKLLYNWILKNINIKKHPKQYEFSRLNLEFCILSKRKLSILIKKNIITGWDDPRIPTISGLRRKGYTPNAIKNFCEKIGVTKQNHLIEFSMLEHCIRKELNKTAIRTMAVLEPIKVFLYNLDHNHKEIFIVPNHPNNPELGSHEIVFSNIVYIDRNDFKEQHNKKYKRLTLGKEVRLRHAYVINAEKIEKDREGNIIKIICYCDLNTLGKKTKNNTNPSVIHWISEKNAFPAEFRLYNQLFKIQNPEKETNFLSYINSQSKIIKNGFIEKKIGRNIQEIIKQTEEQIFFQFERIGYFCIDKTESKKSQLIFHRTVSLRELWKPKI
jgi:glutaminyl-tRNA synthetase